MASRARSSGVRLAIVGATSLKGKELKEVLEDRAFPVKKLSLLDDDEALGQMTEFEGEPTFVQRLEPGTFTENDVVFFASTSGAFTRAHWEAAAAGRAALVDLSHALLDVPEAAVRVPFLEPILPPVTPPTKPWYIAPHAAAIVLLTLLARLTAALRVRQVVATVFEPVSERGAAGLEELQEQTVRLLSFQEFPRGVYDAQLAFNLLARHGAASRVPLEETEEVIRRELERRAPQFGDQLALRLIQAPVFHASCFSVFVELERPAEAADVEQALAGNRVEISDKDSPPAAAVDVAGHDAILIGPVLRDTKRPSAFWLWAAADNLRLTACTAVEIGEGLLE
jgi:aspartate-semialdehyde dehydrogenase